MMKNFLLLLFLFLQTALFSQSNYSAWEKVYTDNNVTVEVSFSMSANSCQGTKNKFRYRVSGTLSTEPRYLNWKIIYKDCSGKPVYFLNSISIGPDGELNKAIESNDFVFTGTWLADKFRIYQPVVTNHPYTNAFPQPLPGDWGIGIISAVITGRKTVCAGESVYLLSKVVDTTSAVSYQWQSSADGKTWSNIAGKTTADCRTPDINATTWFRVVCKDAATGMAMNSNELTIAVVEPVVTVTGTSSVCKGGSASLTASANDAVTGASYRWQMSTDGKTWKDAEGVSTANFKSAALDSETYFRCIYKPGSGFCAATTSDIFAVAVGAGGEVKASGNITICKGGTTELSCGAGAQNTGTYQWQFSEDEKNWTNLKQGVEANYTSTPLFTTTYFRALFQPEVSGCGANISNEVTVTVAEVPQIVAKGNTTVFSEKTVPLKAKGTWSLGDANYQWQESNNEKNWKDLAGATTANIHSPKITSTTFYRCLYRSPISGCEGTSNTVTVTMPLKKEKVEHYSDDKFWVTRLHNPKKLLHIGIDAGIGFNLQPLRVAYAQFPDSAVTLSAKTLGLHAGFIFHPIMKDFCSVGLSLSGDVGSTPLLFAGGKGKNAHETYMASKLNAGTEVAFGYWMLKVLFKYNLSMQTNKLTRTITAADNSVKNFSVNGSLRKEVIGVGVRVGPYAARRRSAIPYNVDVLVTVANDYKFSYGGAWTYQSISGWQVGFETGVWLQSYFKLGFGMSFYDGQKTYLYPDAKNHTSAYFTLTYARDWFK